MCGGTTLYYFKEMGNNPHLTATEKPILIMQGEKDFQAIAHNGRLMKAEQEYGIEQHISQEVIAGIANWTHTPML